MNPIDIFHSFLLGAIIVSLWMANIQIKQMEEKIDLLISQEINEIYKDVKKLEEEIKKPCKS